MNQFSELSFKSLLLTMQFNGQPLATGTGFIVNSSKGPVLVTNRHNVTGRDQETRKPLSDTGGIPNEMIICHHHKEKMQKVIHTEPLYCDPENEVPRWIEHPVLGSVADFVALPLTQLADISLHPYDLANPGEDILIAPAEPVSVIGFPFGLTNGDLFPVWATGFIASEPAVDHDNLPILLVDCRSRPGQSGSPVTAYRSGGAVANPGGVVTVYDHPVSKFIGIYSGRVNAQSDLGRVWKASAILELIQSI